MDLSLEGKKAIVTGGSRGIGRAVAEAFLEYGADVAVVDCETTRGESTAGELNRRYGRARFVYADVSDPGSVSRMVSTAVEELGAISILVNNAGISPKKDGQRMTVWDTTPEDWSRILAVNLSGAFYCAQAVAARMRETGGGAIVNIASLVRNVYTGNASAAYTASKAGLDGLTRVLAMELLPYRIRVNAVAPGRVRTEMTDAAAPEFRARAEKAIPLGRSANPHEVAATVLFLASDASSYLVGTTLDVSGGRGIV